MQVKRLNLRDPDPISSSQPDLRTGIAYIYDDELACFYPEFDQPAIIMLLLQKFGGISVESDDLLAEHAGLLERKLTRHGLVDNPVIASEQRRAANEGPAHRFVIKSANGELVRGVLRRFDISFRYGDSAPRVLVEGIEAFLQSFEIGRIEDNVL